MDYTDIWLGDKLQKIILGIFFNPLKVVNLNWMQQNDFHGDSCSKKAPIKDMSVYKI